MKIRMCLLVICLSMFAVAQVQVQPGIIQGIVFDEAGNPVADAQVTTSGDLDCHCITAYSSVIPTFDTDEHGHFVATSLVVGHHYKVYAKKEDAGYPEMMVGFFNPNDKATIAVAQPKEEAFDVRVQLGPKAHSLQYNIVDSVTGKPVTNPTIHITRADDPADFGGTGCINNKCLVPSDAQVTVEFSAPGYQTWYYPGTGSKAAQTFIATAPGQTTKLDVLLQPVTGKSQ